MPIAELFPEGSNSAEIMAQAFATKHLWDHRYYRLKLWLYTSGTFVATTLGVSGLNICSGFRFGDFCFLLEIVLIAESPDKFHGELEYFHPT